MARGAKTKAPAPAFAKLKFVPTDIVMRDPAELKPFPNNPKIHTPKQVDAIVANIEAFGFDQPTLIDEQDQILKGHGRHLACVKIGCQIPTIKRKGLSDADKWAIVISDNALPAMTGFDNKLLRIGLTQLAKVDYPLNLTGFDNVRLATFGIGPTAPQDDENAPVQAPAKPITRSGEMWSLGEHRIICGDATDEKIVAKVLSDDDPLLTVTDPPYGISFERGKFIPRTKSPKGAMFAPIEGDDLRGGDLRVLIAGALKAAFEGRDGVFYVWSAPLQEGFAVFEAMVDAGIKVQSQIMWKKTPFVLGRADYHWQHEVCWYGFKGANHQWYGGRDKSTFWDIPKPHTMENHPTQKPVECMKRAIENSSREGEAVYDPFVGSGTTLIACETLRRRCLAIDLNGAYVDVTVRRWQDLTGKQAVLQGTKKTFDQVEKERRRKA